MVGIFSARARRAGAVLAMAAMLAAGGAAAQQCAFPSTKVVGGEPAVLQKWPGYAVLRIDDGQTVRYFCGGAVVSKNWLLTAAHCLDEPTKSALANGATIEAVIGAVELADVTEANVYPVVEHHSHPTYADAIRKGDDIALLKLGREYAGKRMPLSLQTTTDPEPGAMLRVAGFGRTQPQQNLRTILEGETQQRRLAASEQFLQATLDFSPTPVCYDANSGFKEQDGSPMKVRIGEGQICAAPPKASTGPTGSCQGDSGGPLVAYKDGCPVQVGIVSWANGCGLANFPSIFTRVSHYGPWIAEMIGEQPQTVAALDPADKLSPQAVAESRQQLEALLGDRARADLSLKVAGGATRFPLGTKVAFEVESAVDGRLLLIDVNADGVATPIFPNSYVQNANATVVRAGERVVIPNGPQYQGLDHFVAVPPVGKSLLIGIVAPEDLSLEGAAGRDFSATRGFKPVGQPTPALQSLIAQAEAAIGENDPSGRWGLAFFEYEVTP